MSIRLQLHDRTVNVNRAEAAVVSDNRAPRLHENVTASLYGRATEVRRWRRKMGYRELLKSYIRHLEVVAGDNFIEQQGNEPLLNKRDLGELRALAAEVQRNTYRASDVSRVENYNYRLRVLMNRHALSADQVARLMDQPRTSVRRWRTNPASDHYRPMTETEFSEFESALNHWLETSGQ
jgi:hypothetical protein